MMMMMNRLKDEERMERGEGSECEGGDKCRQMCRE